MKKWLRNEYILLTGASGGIGRELTKLFIQKYGAKVIGVGRSEEKMRALQAELGELAPSFSYRLFDVADRSAWGAFASELLALGVSPVLLINNAAGFPMLQKTLDVPSAEIERTLRTNFLSAVYAVEAISPLLKKDEKTTSGIVNVCSSAALCTVVGTSAYTASKNALKGYTEALQLEAKGKYYVGILYPGTTATDLFRGDENVQKSAMKKIAASPKKMAKKMVRKIYRRKKRAVLGWDAKAMHFVAKLMPVKGPALIRWVMKRSKSVAFKNIFNEK